MVNRYVMVFDHNMAYLAAQGAQVARFIAAVIA